MSDTPPLSDGASPGSEAKDDVGQPVVWISFCPELGLYHYHNESDPNEDPLDTKFTREGLLDVVTGLMQSQRVKDAQDLAFMCAWGRLFAHKIVVFYTSGMFRVFNPLPIPDSEKEESADMREFLADWKRKYPTSESVPVVADYPSVAKRKLEEEEKSDQQLAAEIGVQHGEDPK
jgi:hypothetical protein